MGLFGKFKRSLGYQDAKLKKSGVEGTGEVLSSKKTMMKSDDGPSVYKIELLVTVPGSEPYEVTCKVEGSLAEGGTYRVFVDREDPNNVFVDHEEMAREQAAAKLSKLTGGSVGSDEGSIKDALMSIREDASKWEGMREEMLGKLAKPDDK